MELETGNDLALLSVSTQPLDHFCIYDSLPTP